MADSKAKDIKSQLDLEHSLKPGKTDDN